MLIKLTGWETGEVLFMHSKDIAVVRRLPALVSEPIGGDGPVRELGARTRVNNFTGDVVLVRETPEEIYSMLKGDEN